MFLAHIYFLGNCDDRTIEIDTYNKKRAMLLALDTLTTTERKQLWKIELEEIQ